MHVEQQVAVKRPVSRVVGGQVEPDLASREHVHSVLPRVAARMAVHYLKEVAMKVDRVLHHRVVDEGHTDALIPSEADRLADLAELPDRKSTRLNSSHSCAPRMQSYA